MPPPHPIVWVALVTALALNVVLLFLPGGAGTPLFPFSDKVVHAVLFGVPAALGLQAGLTRYPWLAAMAAWGGVSEILQAQLTITRSGSLWDALADLAGICLAALLVRGERSGRGGARQ